MDDRLDAQGLREGIVVVWEALTYTEIDFAGFEPVHVDGFHGWLLVCCERFCEEWCRCRGTQGMRVSRIKARGRRLGVWMNARRVSTCLREIQAAHYVPVKIAYPIQATGQGFYITAIRPENIW